MPLLGRHAPVRFEAHRVEVVIDGRELLLPQRLHSTHRPRVVCVCHVDGVKVHHVRRRVVGFGDKARDDDRLSLLPRAVLLAQPRCPDALLAHLREGELAHVGHDLGDNLVRFAEESEALAAARVAELGREHHGHAEGGLLVNAGGRRGEEDVQVVHRGVVECRPPQLRQGAIGQVGLRRGQHKKVRGCAPNVGLLVGHGAVQLACDVGKAQRRRIGLALDGAVDAHVAYAALARCQHVAALAAGGGGKRVHVRVCLGKKGV